MATAHRPPGPYDHPPPGSYDHGPPGSYDHGPPGSYDHGPPGSYDHGPPGSYDHGPPGSYDHEPQYHDLHPDLHEEPYYDQDMPQSATASSSHVHNHRNSHQQQSPGPMPMDPATELAHLKFTPRTSAWKHMQRFERLCSLAYPRATDAGKWSLFVKTIDTTNVWGSGRGMTPGRWLMELSEDWLRKNPQCSQPDCLECKHESMTFDHLKNAFLERWGSPREKPFTHPARSHSLPPSSELGSPGVEFGRESRDSRDSRDRDSDTSLDRALIPHSHHNCGGNHLPAAPTPPNEPTNERERIVQETKTSIAINAHPGTGQIVLQISDKNTTGGGGRKRKGGTEVRAVIDPPQPLAVEAPPPPEPEPPRQLQIVQVIEASPEPPLELKHEEPPTPHAIEAPPSVDDMAVEEPLAIADSTTDCAPQGPPMRARLLEGKVCAITGASRGIGRAIALGFAKEGANIIAHYWGTKSDPANEEIVSLCVEVRGMGQGCTIVFGDISDPRTSDNIIKRAVETYGKIDVAVGNAGMCWYRDFLDVTPELLRRHVDVNLNGNFYFVQAAARQFKAQFHSEPVEPRPDPMPDYSIITISSSSALSNTSSSQAHFNPTAAGIISLMQSTAIALGPYGVRCNALLPGTIQTKMNKEDLQDMEKRGRLEKKVPLGRLGVPSDIVGPAVWLAGEGARYVSGAQILVDGGAFVNG